MCIRDRGTGWDDTDILKPQIMVESVYGDSHPGSYHLNQMVEQAVYGAVSYTHLWVKEAMVDMEMCLRLPRTFAMLEHRMVVISPNTGMDTT